MYHCVHAARDINWMKDRHASGTSLDKYKEKEDAAKAQALRRELITFLAEKGKVEAAQRLAIPGSEGYLSTDEMPYLAEMLQGRIELVDLDMPACPMTTYGEQGPVLFRIAHPNIAEDSTYICDHWVFNDIGPKACKEAKLSQEI